MNRNNFWIHLGIAVTLIVMAAVFGQIKRWQSALDFRATENKAKPASKPLATKRSEKECLRTWLRINQS